VHHGAILLLVEPNDAVTAIGKRDPATDSVLPFPGEHARDVAAIATALGLPGPLRYHEACAVFPADHPSVGAVTATFCQLLGAKSSGFRLYQCDPPFDRSRMRSLAVEHPGR
jgi:hypothetical protein